MGQFFQDLYKLDKKQDWDKILDWLFDDNRFSNDIGWNKDKSQKFTVEIKREKGFSKLENNYFYLPLKKLDCNSLKHSYRKKNCPFLILQKGDDGESKGLIRHIRNGIAHGNAHIISQKNPFIEIIDINKVKQQTAYIYIPLMYIQDLFILYLELLNSNQKQKKKTHL